MAPLLHEIKQIKQKNTGRHTTEYHTYFQCPYILGIFRYFYVFSHSANPSPYELNITFNKLVIQICCLVSTNISTCVWNSTSYSMSKSCIKYQNI